MKSVETMERTGTGKIFHLDRIIPKHQSSGRMTRWSFVIKSTELSKVEHLTKRHLYIYVHSRILHENDRDDISTSSQIKKNRTESIFRMFWLPVSDVVLEELSQ